MRNLYLQGAEDFGVQQAERYLAAIDQALILISSFPYAGASATRTDLTIRTYTVKSHRILYQVRGGNAPLILRILHARQLPPELG